MSEETRAMIEEMEELGIPFEPNGPELERCEHCNEPYQYLGESHESGYGHECPGLTCEWGAIAHEEEARYGPWGEA